MTIQKKELKPLPLSPNKYKEKKPTQKKERTFMLDFITFDKEVTTIKNDDKDTSKSAYSQKQK